MTEDVRASHSDRDQVAEVLHTAYAEGRISHEEHEERIEAALAAKTLSQLTPLTADLLTVPVNRAPGPAHPSWLAPYGGSNEPDRLTASLSETKRTGPWRVRRRTFATIFLGTVQLDLTEATFDAPVVEINVTEVLGSMSLRVPAGTTIRDETVKMLGETSVKNVGPPSPGLPTIILRGTNVFGEIKVRGPKRLPGWKRPLR